MASRLITSKSFAKIIAELAADKKAQDTLILDMRKAVNFCDYFVITSGTSNRHTRAIADGIEQGLAEKGQNIRFKQGEKEGFWILLDIGDVVVHIFDPSAREFYGLEHLWQEAKEVQL